MQSVPVPQLLVISQPEAQAIANYLSTCPWNQVNGFMAILANLKTLPPMPPASGDGEKPALKSVDQKKN